MRPPRRPGSTPVSAITLRRPERSAITSPITARVTPKSTNRCRCDRRAAVIPPASPPIEVATSSTMPSRMFTSPRSRFTVEDADAVAITETRLAAMAARMGTPSARVSRGTRKTPPPRPRSEPTRPVAPPRAMRSQGEKSITSVESYPETAGVEYAGHMALGLAGIDVGLGPTLLGLLAFALLLLLPGLLVVRAPWPAVPFLSLAFWALTWGWLLGASRQPFLRGAPLALFPLVLLPLFKPPHAPSPACPRHSRRLARVVRCGPLPSPWPPPRGWGRGDIGRAPWPPAPSSAPPRWPSRGWRWPRPLPWACGSGLGAVAARFGSASAS